MHFDGLALDGPFQLFNALRRIEGGYRPGVDFQFFHGMGVPYAHYWLYRLFGGGFNGSELARQLLATTTYTIVFLVFFRAFSPNWSRALCLTVAALAVSWLLKFSAVMFASIGMMGLRSALPTLLPVALYLPKTRARRIVATGVLMGVALLMGTEHGIAALIAYVAVMLVVLARDTQRGLRLREIAATLGITAATTIVCLLAVGGFSGMRGALRFNLSTVPSDQYWYFGAPPNQFISTWSGFAALFESRAVGIALIAPIACSIWYLVRVWRSVQETESEASRRAIALATLPIYGLVSCGSLLGSLNIAYVHPLFRVLLMIALVEIARITEERDARVSRTSWLGVPRLLAIGALAAAALSFVQVNTLSASLTVIGAHVARDHLAARQGLRPEGIWPRTLANGQAVIDAHRTASGAPPVLWSTYAGWIEARNNIFHPSADYIIQTLGADNRRAYLEKFRAAKPTLVQTVAPGYTDYEPWVENNNWAFYDELLNWYDVTARTPWSLFWERRVEPAPAPRLLTTIQVAPNTPYMALPQLPATESSATSVIEVELEYEISNPLRGLPLVGSSPRYLVGIGGTHNSNPVSIAPYDTVARFLLFVSPGQKPALHFQTFSLLPGASYTPKVVRLYVRDISQRNQAWLNLMLQTRG